MTRAAIATAAIVLSIPLAASAQAPALTVELRDCAGMERADVQRLLAIELASVTEVQGRMPTLGVTVTCVGDVVRIEVRDPLTDKKIEREIPAPAASEPGAERILALAASQLFVASWLELLVQEDVTAPAPAVRPAQRAAKAMVAKRIETHPRRVTVGAEGDVRARDALAPFATFGFAIRGGLEVAPRLTAFARGRFEAGQVVRDLGVVDLRAVFVGLGAEWEPLRWDRWSLGTSVVFSAGWMGLEGRSSPQAAGHPTDSFTTEMAIAAGPAVDLWDFRAALDLEIGGTVPGPIGTVGGDENVTPGRGWAGVGLRVDYQLP